MKTYKTLEQIFNDAKPHQVTAQELLNGRTRLKDEWKEFKMTDELKDTICVQLAETFGGMENTQNSVYRTLKYTRPQHWGLSRTVITNYGNARLHYIAGQDMPAEIRIIRNALK